MSSGHGTPTAYRKGCRCDECRERQREYSRRYRQANLEKVREVGRERAQRERELKPELGRERSRRYKQANLEKVREANRERTRRDRELNPERWRERYRRYRQKNLEKVREANRNYARGRDRFSVKTRLEWRHQYETHREQRLQYARGRTREERDDRNARERAINDATRKLAYAHEKRWTAAEDATALREDLTSREKAVILGRTIRSVQHRRRLLLVGEGNREAA